MKEALKSIKKYIVFLLKNKEFALPINEIQSIERMQPITRVPNAPPYVKGIINLRGVIIPVIDMRKRIGLEEVNYCDKTRIIITASNGIEAGLIVDRADDVIDIQDDSIKPMPDMADVKENNYLKGVIKADKRVLILLDLKSVLNVKE